MRFLYSYLAPQTGRGHLLEVFCHGLWQLSPMLQWHILLGNLWYTLNALPHNPQQMYRMAFIPLYLPNQSLWFSGCTLRPESHPHIISPSSLAPTRNQSYTLTTLEYSYAPMNPPPPPPPLPFLSRNALNQIWTSCMKHMKSDYSSLPPSLYLIYRATKTTPLLRLNISTYKTTSTHCCRLWDPPGIKKIHTYNQQPLYPPPRLLWFSIEAEYHPECFTGRIHANHGRLLQT